MVLATLRARCAAAALALFVIGGSGAPALGQSPAASGVFIPSFWDPQRRLERPDLSGLRVIRFVTDDEYPPFAFSGPGGGLLGFNVDLARAICEELRVSCTIQARRFDTIVEALERGEADAAVASIASTPATRARVDFTAPYYRTPARFFARKEEQLDDLRPETLRGYVAGVVAGTAHAAFLEAFFPGVERRAYSDLPALLAAVRDGEARFGFADGVTLAVWLNGQEGAACCVFRGGPFLEARYFGPGVGAAVRKDNAGLRRALDYALARVAEQGKYTELYLKYFPVGFF